MDTPRPRVHLPRVRTIGDQLPDEASPLNRVVIPDLWQQQAVTALREGKDVVVHAPTGAGKTLIFEMWSNQGKPRGQAIYTVPTRALANDKLAEWRARGWNVGIATGDLAENLDSPVIVATLETQKNRLVQGDGPALLVVDEYQMIADPDRGLNYELAIGLAPPKTQLLLLSGSVANPPEVVRWLRKLGRDAIVVRHDERPVPLDEVNANELNYHVPSEVRGYWPRFVAKALAEDLGPILIFAPRRANAEQMAAEIARYLPTPNPLTLSPEQKQIVGDNLARLLKSRIAYHHSGLSYAARAGVIEPLAKAGQLRVVVATMGLAAGINFSLRSVAVAAATFRRDGMEQQIRPDEILQMAGRAGRRGIDEVGFFLVCANELRLREGKATQLARSGMVDWGALLGIMASAARNDRRPFAEAVRVQERLFTSRPIFLGVEQSLKHPDVPCGLQTDAERARHVRREVIEMLNSRGDWEPLPKTRDVPVSEVKVARRTEPNSPAAESHSAENAPEGAGDDVSPTSFTLLPATSVPEAMEKVGQGSLGVISPEGAEPKVYGRLSTVAERLNNDRILLAKWLRRIINWNGRQADKTVWSAEVVPLIEKQLAKLGTPVMGFIEDGYKILAQLDVSRLTLRVPVDSHGVALWKPTTRSVMPPDCSQCTLVEECRKLPTSTGTALLWRRLGLVDAAGVPTRRGEIVSFFSSGNGLAIAASLEDERYRVDELIYDLANLDAGFRFCTDDERFIGRMVVACQRAYGPQTISGYLENGVPPRYGAGAEQVVATVHKNPLAKHEWVTELTGAGDIDRVIIEWRSLLRQITHARDLDWPRWMELKRLAKEMLRETESPTMTDLPPLDYHQTKRVEHRLVMRRH